MVRDGKTCPVQRSKVDLLLAGSQLVNSSFLFVAAITLLILLALPGCGGGSRGSGGYEVDGRIQREATETPIPNADVTVEQESDDVKDTTNDNGEFNIRVENAGDATLRFNNRADVNATFALRNVPGPTAKVEVDLAFAGSREPQIKARRLVFFDASGNLIEDRSGETYDADGSDTADRNGPEVSSSGGSGVSVTGSSGGNPAGSSSSGSSSGGPITNNGGGAGGKGDNSSAASGGSGSTGSTGSTGSSGSTSGSSANGTGGSSTGSSSSSGSSGSTGGSSSSSGSGPASGGGSTSGSTGGSGDSSSSSGSDTSGSSDSGSSDSGSTSGGSGSTDSGSSSGSGTSGSSDSGSSDSGSTSGGSGATDSGSSSGSGTSGSSDSGSSDSGSTSGGSGSTDSGSSSGSGTSGSSDSGSSDGSGGSGSGGSNGSSDGGGADGGTGSGGSGGDAPNLAFFSDVEGDRIFSLDFYGQSHQEVIGSSLTPMDIQAAGEGTDLTFFIATKESSEIQRPGLVTGEPNTVLATEDATPPQALHNYSYQGDGSVLAYYSADDSAIRKIIRLGSEESTHTLIENVGTVTGITTLLRNHIEGIVVWAEAEGKIRRMSPNGNSISDIVTQGVGVPVQIAADPINDYIYWIDAADKEIKRTDLSGNVTTILDLTQRGAMTDVVPGGLAIDYKQTFPGNDDRENVLFWSDSKAGKVYSYDIGREALLELIALPDANPDIIQSARLFFHKTSQGRTLYVASEASGTIIDFDFIGNFPLERQVPALELAKKVQVEPYGERLYWISEGNGVLGGAIRSSKYDGTDIKTSLYASGSRYITEFALAPEDNQLIYLDSSDGGGAIRMINLDSEPTDGPQQPLYKGQSVEFHGLAVHQKEKRLFWFGSDDTIRMGRYPRTTEHSEGQVIYTGSEADGISLTYHKEDDTLYWISADRLKVRSYNLTTETLSTVTTSNVELVPGLVVDLAGSKVWWVKTNGLLQYLYIPLNDVQDQGSMQSNGIQVGDIAFATTHFVAGTLYESDGQTEVPDVPVSCIVAGSYERTELSSGSGGFTCSGLPYGVEATIVPGDADGSFVPVSWSRTIVEDVVQIVFEREP